jgi:sulfur-carrier protein
MATVAFTGHLRRFFPTLTPGAVEGDTVDAVLCALEDKHPGLRRYLCEDTGALRKHVNVFVDGELTSDRTTLSQAVHETSELFIVQALSGG